MVETTVQSVCILETGSLVVAASHTRIAAGLDSGEFGYKFVGDF